MSCYTHRGCWIQCNSSFSRQFQRHFRSRIGWAFELGTIIPLTIPYMKNIFPWVMLQIWMLNHFITATFWPIWSNRVVLWSLWRFKKLLWDIHWNALYVHCHRLNLLIINVARAVNNQRNFVWLLKLCFIIQHQVHEAFGTMQEGGHIPHELGKLSDTW